MKKITRLLMVMMFFVISSTIYAQTITGTVNAEDGPLPGANVIVKGTTNGTQTDFDGKFNLTVTEGSGTVVVSFIGYSRKSVNYTVAAGETKDLGVIVLTSDNTLEEVVITGVIDIAKERETPVAVSTIRAVDIQEKLGSQEFPEILNATPSVYATKSGGGFGDSRINIRGFDQRNTAVMINGMPVNDMENGWVYWSNWAGLSDVTSAMQVQRGLGSSKLAISSVGGTINVITRTSEQKEGGSVTASMGNDMYQKYSASYSTGLMDSGFSASFLFSRTTGDGYTDGTKFEGHNYFIGLGQQLNDDHSLMFTFTGAPQWHNQHSRAIEIWRYQEYGSVEEPNRRFNDAFGYLNGEEFSFRKNFYHKPVMSLNWEWDINDNSSFATVLYGSWGRGGGTGPIGDLDNIRDFDYRLRDSNGHVRFDDIVTWNSGGSGHGFPVDDRTSPFINDRSNGITRRASMNSHNWYGVIANYHNDASANFSWDLGIDARTYKGIHYRVVNNILGASGYVDNRDINNPNRSITEFVAAEPSWNPFQNITDQQKIEYYNDGGVRWLGAFGQAEYKTDEVSVFVQGGISNQSFQRIDYFNLVPAEQESDWEAIMGGNIKGGLNWNIDESHNIFGNAGYYSKQPLFNAVYPNFNNNDVNEGLTNEKIVGLELGYGYTSEHYRINVNLYRTSWKDRFFRQSRSGQDGFIDFAGIEQVHKGIEFEGSMRFGKFKFDGMFSIGDFQYKGDVTGTEYDENNNVVGTAGTTFYLDGIKVGDAAQITGRWTINYEIAEGLKFDISQQYYDRNYAAIDADAFDEEENSGSLELPGYSLIDAGVSYKLQLKNERNSVNFRFNVNNLADQLYISESQTNYHPGERGNNDTFMGVNTSNRVYWGFGRTWNATVRFNF
ncbi:MAG: TonB-dependent receptor [Flavobacteriaceae bacterium]|nr:TonB-dependent receptor [Flavobacteriaceae bacterium]